MTTHLMLDNTLGAAFIGLIVASMLHGVSIVQVWYFFGHQSDPWSLKALVTLVIVFDTVHQVLISHTVYTYTVTNWGDPEQLELIVWSMLVEVVFNGLTAFLVQSFLTMRVWRLSNRNKLLTSVVALLVVGGFGCAIAFTIIALHLKTYEQLSKLKYLSILVNALAAAADVLIAGTLCTLLHFSRTGFRRSDTMINKLILFTVNTGFLTSLCAVASLISIVVAGNTFLYIAFFFCIGRLYTNSLLAALNARKMIRRAGEAIHSTGENFALSLRESAKNGAMSSGRPTNISLKTDTTREFASEPDPENNFEKAETSSSSAQEFDEKDEAEFI